MISLQTIPKEKKCLIFNSKLKNKDGIEKNSYQNSLINYQNLINISNLYDIKLNFD